jgi:hypothetical protein
MYSREQVFKIINKAEIENVIIIAPMRPIQHILGIGYTSSNDEPVNVPCKIIEDRYKLSENYKIQIESNIAGFGKEQYYMMDFIQLLNQGYLKLFTLVKDND